MSREQYPCGVRVYQRSAYLKLRRESSGEGRAEGCTEQALTDICKPHPFLCERPDVAVVRAEECWGETKKH